MSDLKTNPDYYVARVDRLPTWGLSYAIIWAMGFSFFITLYDVINVGFALPYIPFVVTGFQASLVASLGLWGYVVGAPLFSYFADIIGRRPTLIFTALLTAIGSLGDALSVNYPMLAAFRFITGMAIGADLVLVMTYMSEMSPSAKRGRYTNLAFIGGWAGIGIGPFIAAIIVTSIPSIGWRIVFLVGAILAFLALAIRAYAPETVRFLASKGKFDEAEKIISSMEKVSMIRTSLTSLPEPDMRMYNVPKQNPFKILAKPKYLKRLLALFFLMFFVYFMDYPFLVIPETWAKVVLGYSGALLSQIVFLFGLAGIGAFLGSIILRPFIDKYDRRKMTIISVIIYTLGTGIMGYGGAIRSSTLFFIGAFLAELIGVGWYQLYYQMCIDNFPTAARATGYSIADGVGHAGGAVGLLVILPLIYALGNVGGWTIPWIPAIIMAILVLFLTPNTVGKRLEEINEATDQ
ncbi:MFS transporter [Sulfolobus sp. A20]|uniref:MFS transporter n=1 Tax=Sulfolobaceae TaxID=118883 RepID=UPI000845D884|nr:MULTISPECIES: MFS transporter [unclassified Sulfolobus]TRM74349.1 MFS transporter [Sulfolobus sp. A20-N-F8]TRM76003.1 MFS transporter [Sulfolobus sp. E5]TRM82619.1 MFS transporter [Sulfolobus sp. A20-N-F6]TRM87449.1 MFS transporter [Sulfolobus sp. E3]TRM87510.1 MFS transporter [Sulfolobus sp. C3]TRM99564.1 MFS transporter [Sulfolobus sp. F1]TRN04628.1 MFS transporter [Sulfolobus sp. E1]